MEIQKKRKEIENKKDWLSSFSSTGATSNWWKLLGIPACERLQFFSSKSDLAFSIFEFVLLYILPFIVT